MKLIKEKKVQSAFRKWARPSVKAGGALLTPVGQLRIDSLEIVDYSKITDEEVSEAGYQNRQELDKELNLKKEGHIYKIRFIIEQEDPRIELRENDTISETELTELLNKLRSFDTRGKEKNWTFKILKEVDKDPGKRAIDYATRLGYEKEWFKLNIRKLKNLGLTISLSNGYLVSPRGKELLKRTS